jgi:hypothetical protein
MTATRFTLAWALMALAMIACSSLGLAPAQTFEQKLAYAYGTHTAVLETAATATRAGTLSQAEAKAVLAMADQSRSLLDSARAVYAANDQAGANSKLTLAVGILTQLQTFLNARGIK